VLLTHHRRARRWFQFGGHLEATDPGLWAAAAREGNEFNQQGYAFTRLLVSPMTRALQTAQVLAEALPEVRVGLVHGRMPPKKKDEAMLAFKAGKIQLLVATTVIEVGVDVPNATVMVIESSCVLLYRHPLGQLSRARLNAIRDSTDGFEIAQRDLELRGPGELLGTRQTGLARMRVADLSRDSGMLPRVHQAAELMLARYPDRIAPLAARWIGADERYGRVG
jgi:ATP-dependent DNA helicase RecG